MYEKGGKIGKKMKQDELNLKGVEGVKELLLLGN